MFKVILLVITCLLLAEGRRLNKIWPNYSRENVMNNVEKRFFGAKAKQVCEDIKEEKLVSTNSLVNMAGYFFPDKIMTVRCKNDNVIATGVGNQSIICKTKKQSFEIAEYDNELKLRKLHIAKDVPVDCIAYKV